MKKNQFPSVLVLSADKNELTKVKGASEYQIGPKRVFINY